ncbi:hypothetical protein GCM10011376_03950 [Nocardioides flavus (ex Wang et al. 2016)]|uniref:Uncharacterized protein n=1 Tax=Nocardioides flavus (ex Wang et al. 2016) TaxID=2058780 RepID=A0ABQ3HDY2_9ACTN|nr:hypothetical protein [Nocardioides flavus (ex Wang et al. 2016)]GHE15497.1 hypothetical protein GCM10011376_03950 [Nocardioides flavus (ex Wang et al. 2016)]
MAAAIVLLVVVVVGGTIAINLYLRGWVREESQREAHLRDPNTHTLAFAIPTGVDPVRPETALALAGFNSGHDRVGMVECIRIEADDSQRDRVRGILDDVFRTEYDSSVLPSGHVVFEDER